MARHSRWRKRSRDEFEDDNQLGVGSMLSVARGSAYKSTSNGEVPSTTENNVDGGGEWQHVESKASKKRRKDGGNYPSIAHSSHSRLQSYVKLGGLQNLVLYLLADGTAPQWCAVRHHANVRKVVTLMVPGLEVDMFDDKKSMLGGTKEEQGVEQKPRPNEGRADIDSSELAQTGDDASDSKDVSQSKDASQEPSYNPVSYRKSHTSPDDYYPTKLKRNSLPKSLQPLSDVFPHLWPIKTPGDDKYAKMHSPQAAMLTAPITKTREEKQTKGPRPPVANKDWKDRRTPITEFIASTEELTKEGYVLHPAHCNDTAATSEEAAGREANNTTTADGWVDTPNIAHLSTGAIPEQDVEKGSILGGRKVLAIDCEMCITSPVGITPQVFSLTRISLIDWDGNVVLDELVRPAEPITDYLTPYSGMTAARLEHVTTSLQEIQKKLINDVLTPQTILVGHSINSDLNALKLTHPYIIDTTLLFPHPRGPPLKSSLKWLAQKYLSREIQKGHGSTGHDSLEDARACLDLVKQKCEKGKAWGTSEASGESIFKRLGRHIRPKRDKANPVGDDEHRTGAVVDWGDPLRGYGAQAKVAVGCGSDNEVVAGIKRALYGDEDDSTVPKGGVDFVFARLRELEAYRGWWNRSKTGDNETLRNGTTANTGASSLAEVVAQTVAHIQDVWESLPACSAFIVYTGSGDPRELSEMQALQQKFKDEYRVKKWDELSVRWTDVEEQKLRRACEQARLGLGFMAVK